MSQNSTIMDDERARVLPEEGETRDEVGPGGVVPPPPPRVARKGATPWAHAVSFAQESIVELRKVTWPTREQTINLTVVVVVVCVLMALLLGAVDYVFQYLVQQLVTG